MIVLGVDPGIATTGWGIIKVAESGKLEVGSYGAIITKAKTPLAQRLKILHQEIKKIIKKNKPEIAAIEELFFVKNMKSAIAVGQARGVVILACEQEKLFISEYTPLQVKQAICGYGHAGKSQIQRMVKVLLNLKQIPKPDDVADALAIAVTHLNSSKLSKILEKASV